MPPKPLSFLQRLEGYITPQNKVDDDGFKYRLCYNEGAYGPSPKAMEAAHAALSKSHRYPDMTYAAIRTAIADKYHLDANRIVAGVGSDELISVLVNGYVKEGDEVIISQYGFSLYEVATKLVGGKPVFVPENNLRMDLNGMLKAVTPRTRMVFIANPNNPTGDCVTRNDINAFLRELPEDIIFVYDAAYAEYIDDEDYSGGFEWAGEDSRVVVLRTFSKIYGLGGLRVGYSHASHAITKVMNMVRKPFNVSYVGEAAAIAALGDDEFVRKSRMHNDIWRENLLNALIEFGTTPYPSMGNFILTRFKSVAQASAMLEHLKTNSILVRPMTGYGLPDCLRFTVGLEHEMLALFAALKSFNWNKT